MQMTKGEILTEYRQAKNKQKQIKILAELNTCSKQDIRDILKEYGEDVPNYGNRYTGKVKDEQKKEPKRTSVRMSQRKKNELKEAVEDISVGLNAMFRDAAEGLNKMTQATKCQPGKTGDVWKEPENFGQSFEHPGEPTTKDWADAGEHAMQGFMDGFKETTRTKRPPQSIINFALSEIAKADERKLELQQEYEKLSLYAEELREWIWTTGTETGTNDEGHQGTNDNLGASEGK